MRVSILDDYQGVALDMADWSRLRARGVEIAVERHPFADEDDVVRSLADSEIVAAMRERTAFPKRVVEYCDGWFPRPGRGFEIRAQLERLHQMADKAGRDRRTLSTSVFRAPADKAALAEYSGAGIDRAVLEIPDLSRDEILRVLDNYVPLLLG